MTFAQVINKACPVLHVGPSAFRLGGQMEVISIHFRSQTRHQSIFCGLRQACAADLGRDNCCILHSETHRLHDLQQLRLLLLLQCSSVGKVANIRQNLSVAVSAFCKAASVMAPNPKPAEPILSGRRDI